MLRTRARMVGWLTVIGLVFMAGCETGNSSGVDLLGESESMGPKPPDKMTLATQARTDGEYEVALALFREILAESPTETRAYLGIGDVFIDQKDYYAAEPYIARAAKLEPRNYVAQSSYGKVLFLLDRLAEALRVYHRAFVLNPEGLEVNLGLGATYLEMDNPEHATSFAEKAVQLDSSNGEARANLGMVYEQVRRHDEAIEQYLIALELMDDARVVMLRLTAILIKEKRYREAANTAESLAKLDPSAEIYTLLGQAHFRLFDYTASIESYRRAVEIDPKSYQAHNGVGVNALNTWLNSDKRDDAAYYEATEAFRSSLKINHYQNEVIGMMQRFGLGS